MDLFTFAKSQVKGAGFETGRDDNRVRGDAIVDHLGVELEGLQVRTGVDHGADEGGVVVDVGVFEGGEDLESVGWGFEGGEEAEGLGEEEGMLGVAGFEDEGVDLGELGEGLALVEEGDDEVALLLRVRFCGLFVGF